MCLLHRSQMQNFRRIMFSFLCGRAQILFFRTTVTDRNAKNKKKAQYSKKFQVLKKRFGFIKVGAPVLNMVGPNFPLTFSVIGYARNTKRFPKITVKLVIVDENGKETLKKPVTMRVPEDVGDVNPDDIRDELGFPVSFPLNRAGKFTIKLQAVDELAKKNIKLDYKITVLNPRKFETGN